MLTNQFKWMVNFAFRFLIEAFLIVAVAVLISFNRERQENLANYVQRDASRDEKLESTI